MTRVPVTRVPVTRVRVITVVRMAMFHRRHGHHQVVDHGGVAGIIARHLVTPRAIQMKQFFEAVGNRVKRFEEAVVFWSAA